MREVVSIVFGRDEEESFGMLIRDKVYLDDGGAPLDVDGDNVTQYYPMSDKNVVIGRITSRESIESSDLRSTSLGSLVDKKLEQFFDDVSGMMPENMHQMIMSKAEKPLIRQIMKRTGGNQVQAAKILGINRNTLRKKIKLYGLEHGY